MLEELGQEEAAIRSYVEAGEAGDTAGFLDLADLYYCAGRTDEAHAALNKALASGDERAHALAARWKRGD